MNDDWLEGNWKELKGQLRQKWAKLTDIDLDAINGKEEVLVGKLQQHYGCARLEARKKIDDFKAELASTQKNKDD